MESYMSQTITQTPTKNLKTKFHFNNQDADLEDFNKAESGDEEGPDFSELHALFESQYQQFLTDTSDEITKCSQRLVKLESILYRNFPAA
jgi:hypothetical protein